MITYLRLGQEYLELYLQSPQLWSPSVPLFNGYRGYTFVRKVTLA